MTATSARRDTVIRLIEIAQGSWDPDLTIARGAVPVLVRKALRAAAHDDELLDEIRELWPVASARPEPLIDAALHGLPDTADARRPTEPTWTVADLEEALS